MLLRVEKNHFEKIAYANSSEIHLRPPANIRAIIHLQF